MRWPLADEIRWIEWRLRELEHGKDSTVPLSQQECRISLAHKRDGKSYADIAREEYPRYWQANKGKRGNQQIISLVRRVVDKVERYLANPLKFRESEEIAQFAADYRAVYLGAVPIYVEKDKPNRKAHRSPASRKKGREP